MGKRTREKIGTNDGVKTVRVYSANPKTADGCNTFIFRRDLGRSLAKLDWLPVIDGSSNPIPNGIRVGDKSIRYSADDKRALVNFVSQAARAQFGRVENDDFGAVEITRTFADEVQCHAISTRREIAAVSSAMDVARRMVHFVASPNEEIGKKRPIKFFEYGLAKVRLSDGLYLVMGEVGVRVNKRPYYDQRVVAKFKADSEVTSLHGQTRIGESAFERVYDNRFRLILQGVEMFYNTCSSTQTKQALEQSPKFSIIIPVYNVAPYLRECLDSVLAQTVMDWEAICVDDGSTDGSGAILDEYRAKDGRILVLHKENGGVCRARNLALELAKGEWVCFVDGDDIVAKDWLSAIEVATQGAEVDWVQTDYTRWYPKEVQGLPAVEPFSPQDDIANLGSTDESKWRCLSELTMTWVNIYRRTALGSVRFDPKITVCEDTAFEMQMIHNVRQVVKVGYKGYYYRMRPESASHRKCPATDAVEYLRVLDKSLFGSLSRDIVHSVTRIVNTSFHACFGWGLQGSDKGLIRRVKKDVLRLWKDGKVRFADVPGLKAKVTWVLFMLTGDFLALHHFKTKVRRAFGFCPVKGNCR